LEGPGLVLNIAEGYGQPMGTTEGKVPGKIRPSLVDKFFSAKEGNITGEGDWKRKKTIASFNHREDL